MYEWHWHWICCSQVEMGLHVPRETDHVLDAVQVAGPIFASFSLFKKSCVSELFMRKSRLISSPVGWMYLSILVTLSTWDERRGEECEAVR